MRHMTTIAAVLLALAMVVASCKPPESPPSPTAAPPVATATSKPASSTPAPTAGAAKPSATAAPPEWQKKWDDTVAAAKKEGELLIYLNAPADARTAIPEAFNKAYGIQINIVMGTGAEVAARLDAEYRAGLHQVDAVLPGATSATNAKSQGFLSPIDPVLILPEVKDPKSWVGGKFPYFDKDGYIVGYLSLRTPPVTYNTEQVKAGQISSYLDLLKPEWKGKLSMFDPTIPGIGNAAIARLAVDWSADRAKEYLTNLLTQQQPVMTKDMGQQADWLAKAKYPVAIWAQTPALSQYLSVGSPIADAVLKERVGLSASNGGLALPKSPPHPNATIVFVNWFLSKEGQTVAVKSMGSPSSRADVPGTGVAPMFVPKPGEPFIAQDEEFNGLQIKLTPEWKAILAKAGY